MHKTHTKNVLLKLIATAYIAVYATVMYFFDIPCIILKLTGIRCLGCGMTRAVISALKLDLPTAFSYHYMFWSLPLLYLCFLFDGKPFKNKALNLVLYIVLLTGFIANWVIHQFFW